MSYYSRNIDYFRNYYQHNKERIKQYQRNYYGDNHSVLLEKKNEHSRKYGKSYRENTRKKIIELLGGKCCNPNCSVNDIRCLQIDHKNGDGCIDRAQHGNQYQYRILKLIINNPEEAKLKFQILCANCNWIKRYENDETVLGRRKHL